MSRFIAHCAAIMAQLLYVTVFARDTSEQLYGKETGHLWPPQSSVLYCYSFVCIDLHNYTLLSVLSLLH